jgi:hypothetical protein
MHWRDEKCIEVVSQTRCGYTWEDNIKMDLSRLSGYEL